MSYAAYSIKTGEAWAVWTMPVFTHTECHGGAWDHGGGTKTCAAASNTPHACKLERTAPGSVCKKGTRSTAAEFQRLLKQGHLSSVRRADDCRLHSARTREILRNVGVIELLDERAMVSVGATVSSLLCGRNRKKKKKVSSLSIALATPVSSTVVHIAILWAGYHRNCPSQTRQ